MEKGQLYVAFVVSEYDFYILCQEKLRGRKMRKAQKQEILEMIQTLHQAHDEVKGYIDKGNFVLAQDILSQCQECSITIGNAIEKLEGEGFVTVSYIENYCDVLFSVYEELNGTDANANKAYKNLKKQLLRIENSVKNDVPVRKEIAFFPYKASMWDALESVYLEAKKDPNCDVYCVPIPYYDRNPDRSLGEMHYEGREYPKNIEVIDWQTYNFEERKPDVIYIHNPYDDWNLVTCVHPRYFSANLKKYTEELVYIPYFVLDEIEPDDKIRIESMKHFCFMPGIVNADKVIVQSEKMKQIYINEYRKAAILNGLSEKHIDRKYLEKKFLGTGSPKFDKVRNTKKEDLEIPEEWLKIIEKPDGSWKKIIFYNTSIAALLEHNEKMLEKMEYVFSVFKEKKDEVALLWRPHPLIKSTVSSMRPGLWAAYDKLVKQYIQESWGIYDDSPDVDRAVVLSDAYYGDSSSVVQLYLSKSSNVLMQNCALRDIDNSNNTFEDIVEDEDNIYILPNRMNCIMQIDKENYKIEKIFSLDSKSKMGGMYSKMTIYNKKIYLFPGYGNKVICFDTNNVQHQVIENIEDFNDIAVMKVHSLFEVENDIYALPLNYSSILMINKMGEVKDDSLKRIKGDKVGAYEQDAIVKNDKIYVLQNGEVVVLDKEEKCIVSRKKINNREYFTIAENSEGIWLCGNNQLDCYDENLKNIIHSVKLEEKHNIKMDRSVILGKYLFLFSIKTGMACCFDLMDKFFVPFHLFNENDIDLCSYEWLTVKLLKDSIWISSMQKNMILVINKGEVQAKKVEMNFRDKIEGFRMIREYVVGLEDKSEIGYPEFNLSNMLNNLKE